MDKKINLLTFLLILAVIIIIIMGIFTYKLYNEKTIESEKSAELQNQVNSLNETASNLQEKINNISDIINEGNTNQSATTNTSETDTTNNNTNKGDVTYTISTRDEVYATIKATKNGKTISKEFEMPAMIDKTGTIDIPSLGTVALVSDSGGEYCGVHIYQLVNNEIKLLGDIDCGADMTSEATYVVETKDEGTAIIKAKINGENITKEFEMSATIDNTSVIDIFDYGKVVLIAESGGEYYGIQVYRLSQDYISGKNKEIKKVGFIECEI